LSIRVSFSLVLATGIAGIAAAHAMPIETRIASIEGLLTSVSSGCGLGVHRGPLDSCTPFYPIYPTYPAHAGDFSKKYYYRGPIRTRTNSPAQSPQRPPDSN